MKIVNPKLGVALMFALVCTPMTPTYAKIERTKKVKYAKTEADKAVGKCALAVLFGGIVGAAVAGKKDRGKGILVGAGAGAVACALIVVSAKKKDRLIAAQIAAARSEAGTYNETFVGDDGKSVNLIARAGPTQVIQGNFLRPVEYKDSSGNFIRSSVLESKGYDCRAATVTLSQSNGSVATVPPQITCRLPNGDYEPFALVRT